MHRLRCLLIFLAVASGTATAADNTAGENPPRCLGLTSIRQMTILDRQHIVFKMDNGRHYLNTLPYPCSGLHRSRAILYRTSLTRLCDLDIITVLDDVGPGFRPQASCGLGRFEPVTEQEFKDLKQELKGASQYKPAE